MIDNASSEPEHEQLERLMARPWYQLWLGPALEAAFDAETIATRNRQLRFYLGLGIALSLGCLALDAKDGLSLLYWGLAGRVGVVVSLHLVGLCFLRARYPVWLQGLAAVVPIVANVAVVTALGAHPDAPGDRYIMAAGMIAFSVNFIVPLRFRHAAWFTLVSVVALAGIGLPTQPEHSDLIGFLCAMTVLALVLAGRREHANKRAFLLGLRDRSQAEALRVANAKLEYLSHTDPLTGLRNRRYFDAALQRSWAASAETGAWVSLMMVDVDHFKAYNDASGHAEGDACLRTIAAAIQAGLADEDLVARFGGEEFVALLPGRSPGESAAAAERVRDAVERLGLPHPGLGAGARVTVSVGVAATVPDRGAFPAAVLEHADQALYRAKAAGRNAVAVADSVATSVQAGVPIAPGLRATG